jgi:hypothetical protein
MLDNAISGVFESGFSSITLLTSSDPEAQGDLIEHISTKDIKVHLGRLGKTNL